MSRPPPSSWRSIGRRCRSGGGITGIIGPNGSGKTTLFNVVTGVHKPTAGRVTWRGQDITGQPAYRIARTGLVRTFQQAMSYPALSVIDNVRIGFEHGRTLGGDERRWHSPEEILDFVGLGGLGRSVAGTIDHDMALMGAVCDRFVVLNFGTKIAESRPADVLRNAKVLEVYLGADV